MSIDVIALKSISVNSSLPSTREFNCASKMVQKLEKMRGLCKALKISTDFNLEKIIWLSKIRSLRVRFFSPANILFCLVPKTGISSWLRYLSNFLPYKPVESNISGIYGSMAKHLPYIDRLSRDFWNRTRFAKSTRVMFIRHPFERLVSYYENRILQIGVDKAREEILKKFEIVKLSKGNETVSAAISFPTVVNAILHSPEFANPHFVPYYLLCAPCQFPYTHLVATETYNSDADCVRQEVGLALPFNLHANRGARSRSKIDHYYLELEINVIVDLWRYYFYDHVLFGYQFFDFGIEELRIQQKLLSVKYNISGTV